MCHQATSVLLKPSKVESSQIKGFVQCYVLKVTFNARLLFFLFACTDLGTPGGLPEEHQYSRDKKKKRIILVFSFTITLQRQCREQKGKRETTDVGSQKKYLSV